MPSTRTLLLDSHVCHFYSKNDTDKITRTYFLLHLFPFVRCTCCHTHYHVVFSFINKIDSCFKYMSVASVLLNDKKSYIYFHLYGRARLYSQSCESCVYTMIKINCNKIDSCFKYMSVASVLLNEKKSHIYFHLYGSARAYSQLCESLCIYNNQNECTNVHNVHLKHLCNLKSSASTRSCPSYTLRHSSQV